LVTEGIDDETLDSYYAFTFGLEPNNRLVFSGDDTVSDRRFRSQVVQSTTYNDKFAGSGVHFHYLNSDDAIYIFQQERSEAVLLGQDLTSIQFLHYNSFDARYLSTVNGSKQFLGFQNPNCQLAATWLPQDFSLDCRVHATHNRFNPPRRNPAIVYYTWKLNTSIGPKANLLFLYPT
jgi:hypothetical protein